MARLNCALNTTAKFSGSDLGHTNRFDFLPIESVFQSMESGGMRQQQKQLSNKIRIRNVKSKLR